MCVQEQEIVSEHYPLIFRCHGLPPAQQFVTPNELRITV